ncbi:hypothetical protein BDK51DRAFT_41801 [Blyttiomyces helicus]|uniref:Uncharacterized protein n=1 Tax=Blyttiomyces helicus TaxID=388810 RepID=A0A4V1ISR0_9FUNG|nr:hypothetical protein BDK51DRAFT_41801 [Blyttiomyces helicus]|eukprot:RKO94427.1 hypothetical protein BDK51DRAFT_41801 [Blyttiomyces helicus]
MTSSFNSKEPATSTLLGSILYDRYEENHRKGAASADEAWAWVLIKKKLDKLRGRKCLLDAEHPVRMGQAVVCQPSNAVQILAFLSVESSPPRPALPTKAKIRDKIAFGVDPGRRGIFAGQVEPLTFPQRRSVRRSITASATAPSGSTSAPSVPNNEETYIYPLNKGDADGLPADSKFDGTLRTVTFSNDEIPMRNLSIDGYRQNARFIQAQRKLNALKRRFRIHLVETKLPVQAYTYEAAIARLKVIFRYTSELNAFYDLLCHRQQRFWANHLRQKGVSKLMKRFIPEGARAKDLSFRRIWRSELLVVERQIRALS